MTSEELYYEFHLLANKNNTQNNINIEKPNFVQLFNRESDRWLFEVLTSRNKDDSINDLQELLVTDYKLSINQIQEFYVSYFIPDDYFNYSESKIKAEKDNCISQMYVYNIHPREINVYMQDEFSKPSFEWEETFSIVSEGKLNVYKIDFDIKDCYLSYYRAVQLIDLEGYIKLNGDYSENKNINLSSVYKRQILDRVVKEVNREFEDFNKFQLSQERILSEKIS